MPKKIFTDEVFANIPVMVHQGLRRREIAALIGCTPSSLQVQCSRRGISLRQQNVVQTIFLPRVKGEGRIAMRRTRPRTLSKETSELMHLYAQRFGRDVNLLIKQLLEAIAHDDLVGAVLDEREREAA